MKKLFLFKESDLKEMIKNLTVQWLHDESIILAIAINFFDGIKELTYSTDKFTPASFVSSAANVAKEDLADVDLLPRIQ